MEQDWISKKDLAEKLGCTRRWVTSLAKKHGWDVRHDDSGRGFAAALYRVHQVAEQFPKEMGASQETSRDSRMIPREQEEILPPVKSSPPDFPALTALVDSIQAASAAHRSASRRLAAVVLGSAVMVVAVIIVALCVWMDREQAKDRHILMAENRAAAGIAVMAERMEATREQTRLMAENQVKQAEIMAKKIQEQAEEIRSLKAEKGQKNTITGIVEWLGR